MWSIPWWLFVAASASTCALCCWSARTGANWPSWSPARLAAGREWDAGRRSRWSPSREAAGNFPAAGGGTHPPPGLLRAPTCAGVLRLPRALLGAEGPKAGAWRCHLRSCQPCLGAGELQRAVWEGESRRGSAPACKRQAACAGAESGSGGLALPGGSGEREAGSSGAGGRGDGAGGGKWERAWGRDARRSPWCRPAPSSTPRVSRPNGGSPRLCFYPAGALRPVPWGGGGRGARVTTPLELGAAAA